MAEANRDPAWMAKALVCSGSFALYQGDYSAAQAAYVQSLAIALALNQRQA